MWAEIDAFADRLDGLRRIGIDEISYRKGQRYLLCAVDHDTGRLVWAATGRNATTLRGLLLPSTDFADDRGVHRADERCRGLSSS